MSGKKCGQAKLNRQGEAELRRQERIRRAREMQSRDQQRGQALQKKQKKVSRILQEAEAVLDSAPAGIVARYAATELGEWKQAQQRAEQAFTGRERALARAQEEFNVATASWRTNKEYYQSGHFKKVDFSSVQRQAEGLLRESQRIVTLAKARQKEERIRQEMERQRAEAQAALIQAQAAYKQFSALPHAAFVPNVASQLERQLTEARRQISQGNWKLATLTAQQARQQGEEQISQVQAAFTTWQGRYEAARSAVEAAQQAMKALDQAFVQTWARQELEVAQAKLRKVARALAAASQPTAQTTIYDQMVEQSRAVQNKIEEAQSKANERYADEMRHKTIVKSMIGVLKGMHFNVGAQFADKSNRLSDVLISAMHPSGQEVRMQIDRTRTINMNLEDGVKGADCVADVYRLIEGLLAAGVELEMSDWGYAHESRVKDRKNVGDGKEKEISGVARGKM